MKWERGYRSDNVDDRRSESGPRTAGLGAGGAQLLFFLFRRFGIAGVLVGGAALYFLSSMSSPRSSLSGATNQRNDPKEQATVEFVSFVFDDVQKTWGELMRDQGKSYQLSRLQLFRGALQSACGLGEAAMGPFYCPGDQRVYIDLSFYNELQDRFGAPGDFAQAYVIAHEVGHHVQNLLGLSNKVHAASEREQKGAQGLSVRLELQADCFAGVWAYSSDKRDLLEPGDIDEALKAASVIGDDALQKQATGTVRPESFTHGSSAQRARWFKRGYQSGDPAQCDTFSVREL
jgi:uncharacterized protein